MILTTLFSYSLVHYETSIGAKIAQFSYAKLFICLAVICIVAKNVFIPSRATRFLENSVPSIDSSTKLDKAKLRKLNAKVEEEVKKGEEVEEEEVAEMHPNKEKHE